MQNPLEFYTAEKSHFEQESKELKNKLALSGTIRLLVFLMIILECISFWQRKSNDYHGSDWLCCISLFSL